MQHPDRGDPGAVEIGYYSVDGRDLTMTEENGKRVDPNVEKSVPIADLRAVYARHCAPADRPNKNTRSVVRQNIGGSASNDPLTPRAGSRHEDRHSGGFLPPIRHQLG